MSYIEFESGQVGLMEPDRRGEELLSPHNSIVIPAFNEEQGLPVVLEDMARVIDKSYEVIVVDDGSTDKTSSVKAPFDFVMVRLGENKGKGKALREGFANAKGENVIWIDADASYPTDTIPQIASLLDEGYDLVYTVRQDRKNIRRINRLGIKALQSVMSLTHATRVTEPFSGLCGLKKVYLDAMELESDQWPIELEIAMKAQRMGLKTTEIPISYNQRLGRSHLNDLVAGSQMMWTIFKFMYWKNKA